MEARKAITTVLDFTTQFVRYTDAVDQKIAPNAPLGLLVGNRDQKL